MPKVIEELREKILAKTKEVLLQDGYNALTIRGVSAACGIAAGTVYNYFSSKDMMVAAVMLEDWLLALAKMKEAAKNLDFLQAAQYRDEIVRLQKELELK